MTKKTTEETSSDITDLRVLLVDMQTATQASIQQQGETFTTALSAVTDHLEALTNALTIRLDPQTYPVINAPLQPAQQHPPPLQQTQCQQ